MQALHLTPHCQTCIQHFVGHKEQGNRQKHLKTMKGSRGDANNNGDDESFIAMESVGEFLEGVDFASPDHSVNGNSVLNGKAFAVKRHEMFSAGKVAEDEDDPSEKSASR